MKPLQHFDITFVNSDNVSKSVPRLVITMLPCVGFCGGILMWLADAAIDVMFIHTDESYWESVFSRDSTEMWMRTLVIIVMTASSIVVQFFMRRQDAYAMTLLNYQEHLEELVDKRTRKLQYLANFDELTGIYNRRKFNDSLEKEVNRARRYHHPLSLVMSDIDFFKNVNDTYGHKE